METAPVTAPKVVPGESSGGGMKMGGEHLWGQGEGGSEKPHPSGKKVQTENSPPPIHSMGEPIKQPVIIDNKKRWQKRENREPKLGGTTKLWKYERPQHPWKNLGKGLPHISKSTGSRTGIISSPPPQI